MDKKGRPVTTLAQSDFEVFEDGVPQTILTFDRHAPNPNATAEDAAAELGLGGQNRASRASARGPSVTAIAFDRLSPEGRMLAYRAAKRFVQNKQADELAGVFIVDQALRTLAPYTTDPVKLSAAVEQAANTATTQLDHERTMAEQVYGDARDAVCRWRRRRRAASAGSSPAPTRSPKSRISRSARSRR